MIDFFFGKPRTGKSYRAVHFIYNEYVKKSDVPPKYPNILTNIGGFKFDKINEAMRFNGNSGIAYKLVWKRFYDHLKKLHSMALDEKSDEELNRYADYHKINDSLIVIDEASLYFKKYDDVLSWWLAYHGHFRIRIIMIAQSPKQINSDYLVHTEIYYESQPQAKQLRSNQLRYIHHSEVPFNKDSKFSSDTLTMSQDIHNLYNSGEVDKPKKIIYKYIMMAGAAALAIVVLGFVLINNMKSRVQTAENNINSPGAALSSVSPVPGVPGSMLPDDSILLNIRCDEQHCWNKDDLFEHKAISLQYFKNVVFKFDLELFYHETGPEIYKSVPVENIYKKVTLAKFTDYVYNIPKSFKSSYLKDLFIPIKPDKPVFKINNSANPFNNINSDSSDNGATTSA